MTRFMLNVLDLGTGVKLGGYLCTYLFRFLYLADIGHYPDDIEDAFSRKKKISYKPPYL
jgi:hypothetical protein